MGTNSGDLPKNQSFGRFRLDKEAEINSLASIISREKPELLEVVLGDESYIVSCLKSKQVPLPAERTRLGEFSITKKEVIEFLYSVASQFSSAQTKRVIMERFNNSAGKACYRNYYVVGSDGS